MFSNSTKKYLMSYVTLFSEQAIDEISEKFLDNMIILAMSSVTDPKTKQDLKSVLNEKNMNNMKNMKNMNNMIKSMSNAARIAVDSTRNIPDTSDATSDAILDQALEEVNMGPNKNNQHKNNQLKDNVASDKAMSEKKLEEVIPVLVGMVGDCISMSQNSAEQAKSTSKSSKPSRKVKFSKHTARDDEDEDDEEEWTDVKPTKATKNNNTKSSTKHQEKEESESDDEEDEESDGEESEYDNEWSAFHKLVETHQAVVEAYVHLLNKYSGVN
jgi:hypothetical protein